MTKRNDTLGLRLRKTIKSHQQFKQSLNERLMVFDDLFYNQQQAYLFYSRALLSLTQEGDEPEPWIIGALVLEQRLRRESEGVTEQFSQLRQWIRENDHV